jgi:CRISPR-associated protein Csb1
VTDGRTVLTIDLAPLVGTRFQPTGFPDLGAAEFGSPGQPRTLLVESTQSMANRLEATTWDPAALDQSSALAALPYVRVINGSGEFLSSSRLEAHRLASAYVMDGVIDGRPGRDWLVDRFGLVKGRPLDTRTVARECFALDPVSLIHGVFFAQKPWPWQPRILRAVTSFIEAYDVSEVITGGVKRDVVNNEGKDGATAEGYGSVPHHRSEYVAAGGIVAYVAVDRALLRTYGLPEPAVALLDALIDYELGSLFQGVLRLRTACDLTIKATTRGHVPDPVEAGDRVAKAAANCADQFAGITEVVWTGRPNKARSNAKGAE